MLTRRIDCNDIIIKGLFANYQHNNTFTDFLTSPSLPTIPTGPQPPFPPKEQSSTPHLPLLTKVNSLLHGIMTILWGVSLCVFYILSIYLKLTSLYSIFYNCLTGKSNTWTCIEKDKRKEIYFNFRPLCFFLFIAPAGNTNPAIFYHYPNPTRLFQSLLNLA